MSNAAEVPRVVCKLGGSLLDAPDLARRLPEFVRGKLASSRPVVVTGGGAVADVVRGWEAAHGLSADAAHELAIAAMDFNARLIREMFLRSGITIARSADHHAPGSVFIPNVLDEIGTAGSEAPPATWDLTSDSLAAWIARRLGAARVVLLKSVDPPADHRLSTAVGQRLVDPLFPRHTQGLPVQWVNLRSNLPDVFRMEP